MAYPRYLREKARELRIEDKLSLDEIVDRLSLPRSTVRYWIRDIPLQRDRQNDNQRKGTQANQESHRRRRLSAYQQGLEEAEQLLADPALRDFVVLYMAEGYKRSRHTVSLANSDPAIVLRADSILKQLIAEGEALSYALQYHADQDPQKLREFWGALVEAEPSRIRLQRKSNSNQMTGRKWRSVHGVMTVSVHQTLLRCRIEAWMAYLRAEWGDTLPEGPSSLVMGPVYLGVA